MSVCVKCGEEIGLSTRSVKYCSKRCSVLYLKSQYKKRKPEKVKQWKKTYYGQSGKHITADTVRTTLARFGSQCFRCGWSSKLEVHHWKPYKYGGTNEAQNLVVFCKECHVAVHEEMKSVFWKLNPAKQWERTELIGDGFIEDLEEMPSNPSDVLLYLEKEALET